jgi:hypothetical protein
VFLEFLHGWIVIALAVAILYWSVNPQYSRGEACILGYIGWPVLAYQLLAKGLRTAAKIIRGDA